MVAGVVVLHLGHLRVQEEDAIAGEVIILAAGEVEAPVVDVPADGAAGDESAQVHAIARAGEEDAVAGVIGVAGVMELLVWLPSVAQDDVGDAAADVVDVDVLETVIEPDGREGVDRLAEVDIESVILLRYRRWKRSWRRCRRVRRPGRADNRGSKAR